MPNKKSSKSAEPSTLNPDMQAQIIEMMKQQGVELDAEALKMLNQVAGKEFEETYKRIAAEKCKSDENMDQNK
jgi:hypothetical protein